MTNSQYRRNIGEKGVNDSDSYEKSDKREHKEEKYRETEKKNHLLMRCTISSHWSENSK